MGDPSANDREYFSLRAIKGLSAVQRELLSLAYPTTRPVLGTPQRVCPAIEVARADAPAARGLKQRGLAHVWRDTDRRRGPTYLRLSEDGKAYVVAQLRPRKPAKLTPPQLHALITLSDRERDGVPAHYLRQGSRYRALDGGPRWVCVAKLHYHGLVRSEQQASVLTIHLTTHGIWRLPFGPSSVLPR